MAAQADRKPAGALMAKEHQSNQTPDSEADASSQPRPNTGWSPVIAAALIVVTLGVCVVLPAAWMAVKAGGGVGGWGGGWGQLWPSGADWGALRSSFYYAGGISVLAVVMAWAPARVLARWPRSMTALACVPMLLPPYLAYAGWSLLRAPGSMLGDAVFRASSDPGMAWLPMAVGRACAVIGLASWAWPVVAVMLARAMRWQLGSLDEQLSLDGASWGRAMLTRVRVLRGSLVMAFGLVMVVMLGSAIPLHVAQADTFALRLWLRLDQSGPDQAAAIWAAGWPLWLPGMLAGLVVARAAMRSMGSPEADPPMPVRVGRWTRVVALGVWVVSALVPLALFGVELFDTGLADGLRIIERFVASADRELGASLILVPVMALIGVVLTLASAMVASAGRFKPGLGRVVGLVLVVSMAGALAPGVLVGSGIANVGYGLPDGVSDGPWLSMAAMIARWSVLPIVGGVMLALSEPRAFASLRWLDTGSSWRGFWAGWLKPHAGVIMAIGCLFALLGFHEIEATVQVASPQWPSLPRKLLNMLHFARDDDLSAAVVLIEAPTLILIVLTTAVVGWRRR